MTAITVSGLIYYGNMKIHDQQYVHYTLYMYYEYTQIRLIKSLFRCNDEFFIVQQTYLT